MGKSMMDGKGTYQSLVTGDKLTGTWLRNTIMGSDGKMTTIAAVAPPKVFIQLTPTVKSLSENMVKTPKLPAAPLSAAKKQQFNQMVATWQKSKPLNINNLKKSGKLKIDTDPNLKVTSIQNPDYVYNGQVKSVANTRRQLAAGSESTHLVSQGIGQQYGTWGIYEGQFEEGKITGYGRIIMPN